MSFKINALIKYIAMKFVFLQTQGLGTALKILFSEKLNYVTETNSWNRHTEVGSLFRLSRTEIVALFNAFGR